MHAHIKQKQTYMMEMNSPLENNSMHYYSRLKAENNLFFTKHTTKLNNIFIKKLMCFSELSVLGM